MQKVIHRADSRGVAEHGWLHSRHTFSFANYYNPDRMGFGKLRVINDDIVEPGCGFSTHPHNNMEIISIPLAGGLRHRDSMGNRHVIRHSEVQVMSAGSGLTHSEYNDSARDRVNFLQIWVLPAQHNIEPRYGQLALDPASRHNQFQIVISPEKNDQTVWINQDAFFALGNFDRTQSGTYKIQQPDHGVYLFVIEGSIEVENETLNGRDAIGLTDISELTIKALAPSQLLVIEIPM